MINILCPFSFPKLRFWYFIIGNSLPLVLSILLKVTNPLSDLTIYWHLKLFLHFLLPQIRDYGVSLSLPCQRLVNQGLERRLWLSQVTQMNYNGDYIQPIFKGPIGKPVTFRNRRGISLWSVETWVWLSSNHLSRKPHLTHLWNGVMTSFLHESRSLEKTLQRQKTSGEFFLPRDLWFWEQLKTTLKVLVARYFGGLKRLRLFLEPLNCL